MKLLDTAGKAMNRAGAVLAKAFASKPHRCDPTGFACDCARKAEVNARRSSNGSWLGPRRRGGWLK